MPLKNQPCLMLWFTHYYISKYVKTFQFLSLLLTDFECLVGMCSHFSLCFCNSYPELYFCSYQNVSSSSATIFIILLSALLLIVQNVCNSISSFIYILMDLLPAFHIACMFSQLLITFLFALLNLLRQYVSLYIKYILYLTTNPFLQDVGCYFLIVASLLIICNLLDFSMYVLLFSLVHMKVIHSLLAVFWYSFYCSSFAMSNLIFVTNIIRSFVIEYEVLWICSSFCCL